MDEAPLYLTDESVRVFYQVKLNSGVSSAAVAKYKSSFDLLIQWLGEEREVTALRLQEWRRFLESSGYSKYTIEKYVQRTNDYLRMIGRKDLCIPKPMRNELTNQTFGYLTAIEPTKKRQHRYVIWRCKCRCGKEVEISSSMLLRGCTTSCGCLKQEILQHANRYEEGTELRQVLEEKVYNPNSASGYVGVQPKRGKWAAYITYKKKHYYLGTFQNIEDAVKARARAKEAVMEDAARIYAETDHLYGDRPSRPEPPERVPFVPPNPTMIPVRRRDNTSGCPGVTRNKGKWSVSISVQKFRYRLGVYEELEDAVAVRKKAEALVAAGDLEALKAMCTNSQDTFLEEQDADYLQPETI